MYINIYKIIYIYIYAVLCLLIGFRHFGIWSDVNVGQDQEKSDGKLLLWEQYFSKTIKFYQTLHASFGGLV